jgi:hypothetical protein
MLHEVEDMVSLRAAKTGVRNTIFISTKGYRRQAVRSIHIAMHPADSFLPPYTLVSMTIPNCKIIGEHNAKHKLAPDIKIAAQRFIARNRAVLLDYWDGRIDAAQLIERLK